MYLNNIFGIQDRFSTVDLLAGYRTVEQCSIEYTPETGSSIDPHIDDCWIWGERKDLKLVKSQLE